MKSAEFSELKDMIEGIALLARQSAIPSQVLLEIRNDMKEMKEQHNESHKVLNDKLDTLDQKVSKTNGRVTKLELWQKSLEGFAKGVKAGGRGVWVGIATVIGIAWVVFGEFIKRKLSL